MKRKQLTILLSLMAVVAGCNWESALYDQFVSPDIRIMSCAGYCDIQRMTIDKSKCSGEGLDWIEARCFDISNGTIQPDLKTPEACNEQKHEWQEARCNVTTRYGCYQVDGRWNAYQLDMLDLGNGEYIRAVTNGYACGKYADVILATQSTSCPATAIELLEQSQKYSICPHTAPNCLSYVHHKTAESESSEDADATRAMCSSCAEGMAICYENNKFQCVDLNTSTNHCGICGNKCESANGKTQSCINGECVTFQCLYHQCEDENHTCINPASNDTCGATCDKPQGESCDQTKGLSCMKTENDVYKCACESGISNKEGKCVNPAANETCNAKPENPTGKACPSGTVCKQVEGIRNYECICAKSWEATCHKDGADYCINPASDDKHCGAPLKRACEDIPEYQCSPSQQCENGTCVCREGFASCDNKCIDGSMHDDHCGAKGKCNDPNESSENYAGKECGSNAYCTKSECACDDGYIMCNGSCISPSNNAYCGASLQNDVCNKGVDCTTEARKSCQKQANGSYQCACDSGYVECDGKCIDPTTSSQYCGAKGNCKGDNKDSTNYKGEKCEMICADSTCKSTCMSEDVLCETSSNEKGCIKQSRYNLKVEPGNCTACDDEHCPDLAITDNKYFYEDRCWKKDDSNRLHTDTNCSECGDTCKGGKTCQYKSGKYTCDCPTGTSLCGEICVDLEKLHKTDCKTCMEGWADCQTTADDGCETRITDDKNNCGQCGNNCDRNLSDKHVSNITCSSGICQFNACESGYGDCDNNTQNGCETDLTSMENCGSCGNSCDSQPEWKNYTISCVNSNCIKECSTGYKDCDGKESNGCETNISSDVRNCGKCGNMCDYEYNLKYYQCTNSLCCNINNVLIYDYELCCDKKYKQNKCNNRGTRYICAQSTPNKYIASNNACYDWEEVSNP
ncbi:MAG: hypothetical protein IKY83_06405 [Proteobacteria bacterium]|nr:hypothetical protein [Pseudomonadota bacterium]